MPFDLHVRWVMNSFRRLGGSRTRAVSLEDIRRSIQANYWRELGPYQPDVRLWVRKAVQKGMLVRKGASYLLALHRELHPRHSRIKRPTKVSSRRKDNAKASNKPTTQCANNIPKRKTQKTNNGVRMKRAGVPVKMPPSKIISSFVTSNRARIFEGDNGITEIGALKLPRKTLPFKTMVLQALYAIGKRRGRKGTGLQVVQKYLCCTFAKKGIVFGSEAHNKYWNGKFKLLIKTAKSLRDDGLVSWCGYFSYKTKKNSELTAEQLAAVVAILRA
mmetsp:Transcript_19247/g.36211  ORF Transcript_19247/g.36211 Transcript_19247/m.36211 type:complete len:274 (-) Transcript_19247:478-1299(-)